MRYNGIENFVKCGRQQDESGSGVQNSLVAALCVRTTPNSLLKRCPLCQIVAF